MSAVPPFPVAGAPTPATTSSAPQLSTSGGASTRSSLPRAAAAAGNGAAATKKQVVEEPQHVFEEESTEGVTSNWEVAVSRQARLPLPDSLGAGRPGLGREQERVASE